MELGRAIRTIREARGLRLSILAKSAHVSVPFLSLVENDARQPSLDVIRRLSQGLGIPPEVLILLGQSAGGSLRTGDSGTRDLAQSVQKLIAMEAALRRKLQVLKHASEGTIAESLS